eukprot:g959.t1
MGFVYSRQPHSLELPDIHRAVKLVELFMWIYISTSALQVALSVIPTSVHKDEDGWCVEAAVVSPGISTAILICQVLSTFVGSAGFSIISSATDEVYKAVDPDNDYNFKRKAVTGGCYLQLPLVKVFLGFIPLGTKQVSIPVPLQVGKTSLPGGNYTTSWTTLDCPVFDDSVVAPMLFCCVLTVFMAYLAVVQMRIYSPGETFDDLFQSIKDLGEPEPLWESSSEEDEGPCA